MDVEWMNLPQAAKYLDVANSTLRRWARTHQITYYFIAGRYKFQKQDLDDFVTGSKGSQSDVRREGVG